MTEIIKQLDTTKNELIDTQELHNTLTGGFFDNEENVKMLIPHLNTHVGTIDLANSPPIKLEYMIVKEGEVNRGLHQIYAWVQKNDSKFIKQYQIVEQYHREKGSDYIKREMVAYALEQYGILLEKKLQDISKQSGYTNQADIVKDQEVFTDYQAFAGQLKQKYPGYTSIIEKIQHQEKNYNNLMKQHKLNQKLIDITLAETQKLQKDKKITETVTRINNLNLDTATSQEIATYLKDLVYINEVNSKITSLKPTLDRINQFSKDLTTILPTQKDLTIVARYNHDLNARQEDPIRNALTNQDHNVKDHAGYAAYINQQKAFTNKINGQEPCPLTIEERIDRYYSYMKLYKDNQLDVYSNNYSLLSNGVDELYTKPDQQRFLPNLKRDAKQQNANQKSIDVRHNFLKQANPIAYTGANFARGVWEGFWKGAGGVYKGLKMGFHLLKGSDKQLIKYDMKHIDAMANTFSFERFQSTGMNKQVVSNGKLSMDRDNTVNQVGQQAANMLLLLSGGGAASKGLQGLGMSVQLAAKMGLMTSAMSMQTGQFFDTAIQAGISPKESLGYALIQGGMSAGLELISPNSAFLGNFSINAGTLFTAANKTFVVQFCKNIGKEIGQEIVQEEMQLIAEKGLNSLFNGSYSKQLFEDKVTLAEIYSTAILTGLTTGLMQSKAKYTETKINHHMDTYIDFINKHPALKNQQIAMIDKMITEHATDQNIVQYYQELKERLGIVTQEIGAVQKPIDVNTLPTFTLLQLNTQPSEMTLDDFISMDSQLQGTYLAKHFNNEVELSLDQFTDQYSKFLETLISKYPADQQATLREEYGVEKKYIGNNETKEIQPDSQILNEMQKIGHGFDHRRGNIGAAQVKIYLEKGIQYYEKYGIPQTQEGLLHFLKTNMHHPTPGKLNYIPLQTFIVQADEKLAGDQLRAFAETHKAYVAQIDAMRNTLATKQYASLADFIDAFNQYVVMMDHHAGGDINASQLTITPQRKQEILEALTPTTHATPEGTTKNQYDFSPEIQTENSLNSDNLIDENGVINTDAVVHLETFLRAQNVLGGNESLNEDQIRKISEVHFMKRNEGETDDVQLNVRKGIKLRSVGLNEKQIRVMMEGRVCGVIDDITKIIKDIADIMPNRKKLQYIQQRYSFVYKKCIETGIKQNDIILLYDTYITLNKETRSNYDFDDFINIYNEKIDDLSILLGTINKGDLFAQYVNKFDINSFYKFINTILLEQDKNTQSLIISNLNISLKNNDDKIKQKSIKLLHDLIGYHEFNWLRSKIDPDIISTVLTDTVIVKNESFIKLLDNSRKKQFTGYIASLIKQAILVSDINNIKSLYNLLENYKLIEYNGFIHFLKENNLYTDIINNTELNKFLIENARNENDIDKMSLIIDIGSNSNRDNSLIEKSIDSLHIKYQERELTYASIINRFDTSLFSIKQILLLYTRSITYGFSLNHSFGPHTLNQVNKIKGITIDHEANKFLQQIKNDQQTMEKRTNIVTDKGFIENQIDIKNIFNEINTEFGNNHELCDKMFNAYLEYYSVTPKNTETSKIWKFIEVTKKYSENQIVNLIKYFKTYGNISGLNTVEKFDELLEKYGNYENEGFQTYLNEAINYFNKVKNIYILSNISTYEKLLEKYGNFADENFQTYLNNAIPYYRSVDDIHVLNNFEFGNMILVKFDGYTKECIAYIQVCKNFINHPIPGLRNISEYILEKTIEKNLNTEQLQIQLSQFENIYTRNHLPEFYKGILVHNIIHGENYNAANKIQKDIKNYNQSLIYKDLLKSTLESNNLDLKVYLNGLLQLKSLVQKVEGGKELTKEENKQFNDLIGNLKMIYSRRNSAPTGGDHIQSPIEEIQMLKNLFQPIDKNSKGEKIQYKESGLFTIIERKIFDGKSIESLLQSMTSNIETVSKNHTDLIHNNYIDISQYPVFVKGFKFQFFESSWDFGWNSPEFIGSNTKEATRLADATPYDVDMAGYNQGTQVSDLLQRKAYDDGLLLVVFDRGQLINTDSTQKKKSSYTNKYEIIFTPGSGEFKNRYGVRHSLGSTMVDCIIARNEFIQDHTKLQKLKYTITKQGFYTPVIDENQKVIFTPAEFESLRKNFIATGYSNGEKFIESNQRKQTPYASEIQIMTNAGGQEQIKSSMLKGFIENTLRHIIGETTNKKGDMTKAMINEMGSTARGSDLGGEADFDFLVRIPATEGNNINAIANQITKEFSADSMEGPRAMGSNGVQFYQIILKGVQTDQGVVDLDIAVALNDSFMETDPDIIIANKYEYIRNTQGEEVLQNVLANIKRTKKMLKESGCYKKGTHGEGGLGGLGVENRILTHDGDAIKAFTSRYKTAYQGNNNPISFQEFQKQYVILGTGINARTGESFENFVTQNMTEEGYIRMSNLSKKIISVI